MQITLLAWNGAGVGIREFYLRLRSVDIVYSRTSGNNRWGKIKKRKHYR